jgi:hypothetical protein
MYFSNQIISTILIITACILPVGCASIKSYSTVDIKPDVNHIYVLTPAPLSLLQYGDTTTAAQWERTYNYGIQKKNAIAKEIDQRESRLFVQKFWLLTIGGLAGLVNTIYIGIKEESKTEKIVTVPLAVISGTALLSSLPTFSRDERLDILKEKAEKLDTLKSQAEDALNELDVTLVDKALLDQAYEQEKDPQKKEHIEQQINDIIRRVAIQTSALKKILTNWSTAAQ